MIKYEIIIFQRMREKVDYLLIRSLYIRIFSKSLLNGFEARNIIDVCVEAFNIQCNRETVALWVLYWRVFVGNLSCLLYMMDGQLLVGLESSLCTWKYCRYHCCNRRL